MSALLTVGKACRRACDQARSRQPEVVEQLAPARSYVTNPQKKYGRSKRKWKCGGPKGCKRNLPLRLTEAQVDWLIYDVFMEWLDCGRHVEVDTTEPAPSVNTLKSFSSQPKWPGTSRYCATVPAAVHSMTT